MTLETVTAVLGWASLINIGILVVSTVMLIAMRDWVAGIHARLFGLERPDLGRAYFQYLGQYKIAIIVLNVAPYLALRIVA